MLFIGIVDSTLELTNTVNYNVVYMVYERLLKTASSFLEGNAIVNGMHSVNSIDYLIIEAVAILSYLKIEVHMVLIGGFWVRCLYRGCEPWPETWLVLIDHAIKLVSVAHCEQYTE